MTTMDTLATQLSNLNSSPLAPSDSSTKKPSTAFLNTPNIVKKSPEDFKKFTKDILFGLLFNVITPTRDFEHCYKNLIKNITLLYIAAKMEEWDLMFALMWFQITTPGEVNRDAQYYTICRCLNHLLNQPQLLANCIPTTIPNHLFIIEQLN
jgi:hypothetical protein